MLFRRDGSPPEKADQPPSHGGDHEEHQQQEGVCSTRRVNEEAHLGQDHNHGENQADAKAGGDANQHPDVGHHGEHMLAAERQRLLTDSDLDA
jgi:hypothetical protein